MNPETIIAELRGINAWRRGGEEIEQPDPKHIGEVLDAAADSLASLIASNTTLRRERIEARAEVAQLKGALSLGQENCDAEYEALREERDESKADLARMEEYLRNSGRNMDEAQEQIAERDAEIVLLTVDRDNWRNQAQTELRELSAAQARVKELEATCAELVTDGNALTLAANLAKQSQRAEQAESRVKELQKQEAESRRLFYAEQDKRQSAEHRNAELEKQNELLICDRARFPDKSCEVGNIIAAHIENLKSTSESNAEAWRWACVRENALKERNDELVAALRDLHGYPADNDVHKHAAEVIARNAAGESAKHPDTEIVDWLDSAECYRWMIAWGGEHEEELHKMRPWKIRDAVRYCIAARKEVQP